MCICRAASDGGHDLVDEASVVFGACRKGEKSRRYFDLLTFHANIIAVHTPPLPYECFNYNAVAFYLVDV